MPITVAHFGASVLDTKLHERQSGTNFGSTNPIACGFDTSYREHWLARFNISAIPVRSKIVSAVLAWNVTTAAASGQASSVHRITQVGWTEGGATWLKYDGSSNWASAGGDYDATAWKQFAFPTSTGVHSESGFGAAVVDALTNRSGLFDVFWRQVDSGFFTPVRVVVTSSELGFAQYPRLTIEYVHPAVFRRLRQEEDLCIAA